MTDVSLDHYIKQEITHTHKLHLSTRVIKQYKQNYIIFLHVFSELHFLKEIRDAAWMWFQIDAENLKDENYFFEAEEMIGPIPVNDRTRRIDALEIELNLST